MIDGKLVVFHSDPDFSDSPRALHELMVSKTDYQTFWIIDNQSLIPVLQEHGISCALRGSDQALQAIRRARFMVSSSFYFESFKQPGQLCVSTWHGFGPKIVGFVDTANAPESSFSQLKTITLQCDLLSMTSRFSQVMTSGMFAMDMRKVKVVGFPRNDFLFTANGNEQLQKILGANVSGAHLFLYLPTMHKGIKNEGAQFEENIFNYSDYSAEAIDAFLEEHNSYIVAKLHFADRAHYADSQFVLPRRVLLIDDYMMGEKLVTLYHVMNAFECLITDYSSAYTDFMLLDRPIVFSCPDIQQFQQDRGFVADNPSFLMPGPMVDTWKGLSVALGDVLAGRDAYRAERQRWLPLFHTYRDSHSCERLLQVMEESAMHGAPPDAGKDILVEGALPSSRLFVYGKQMKATLHFAVDGTFRDESMLEYPFTIGQDIDWSITSAYIPENAEHVLLTPDVARRCVLSAFQIEVDGIPIPYHIHQGIESHGTILFTGRDGSIIVELPRLELKPSSIVLHYKTADILDEGKVVLGELIQHAKNDER